MRCHRFFARSKQTPPIQRSYARLNIRPRKLILSPPSSLPNLPEFSFSRREIHKIFFHQFLLPNHSPAVRSNEIIARERITLLEINLIKTLGERILAYFPFIVRSLNVPTRFDSTGSFREGAKQRSLKRRNNNLIGLLARLPVSKLTSIRN